MPVYSLVPVALVGPFIAGAMKGEPAHMADPLLVSASATFHTRDDDKSDDTLLSIGLILPDGTVAASVAWISGRFPDDHDNGPFCLTVHEPTKRSELKNSAAALHIETRSSDT
jgi:hypothetical protein